MRSTQALLPGATFGVEELLAPHQALTLYEARVRLAPTGIETVPLAAAYARVLANNIVAHAAYPAHARSTMDGFAVRSADACAARQIVGEIRMGHAPPASLGHGEAMYISTGGVLPAGADAVVPIEDAEVNGDQLTTSTTPTGDAFVTARGSDMQPGDVVASRGRRIGGPELGVLATLGCTAIEVYRRPRLAIISTGDELVEVEMEPGIGQIRDSNRWALTGALTALGADVIQLPVADDDFTALRAVLADALTVADGVFLSGGSSVGERDLTPDVIDSFEGPGVIVHGLRVKPGKPTVLGAIGTKPVIGLPGNPTSALMILEAVCVPLVRTQTGDRTSRPAVVTAPAGEAFLGRAGWTWLVPAELRIESGVERAFPLALRSAHTSLLARASGYVVLGEDRAAIAQGESVQVVRFSSGGR